MESDMDPQQQARLNIQTNLQQININMMASYLSPPQKLRQVLMLVVLLMNQQDLNWQNIRALIKSQFIERVKAVDPRRINPKARRKANMIINSANMRDPAFRTHVANMARGAELLLDWGLAFAIK